MSSRALAVNKAARSNLRPFDIRRDLLAVADLVELCFQDSLDADGRLYIRQMRQTARSGSLARLAASASLTGEQPPGGFVWLEAGSIIGNLSLIPIRFRGRRRFLIANVAVHPDFRRRGIARALTQAALEKIGQNHSGDIWLQVDESNQVAHNLYRSMDFVQRALRSTWQAKPSPKSIQNQPSQVKVRRHHSGDWAQQSRWLEDLYPSHVRWNLPLDFQLFQPGWRGSLQRLIDDRHSQQWSAHKDGELLGVLSWQSSTLHADRLWLATSEEYEELALPALLRHMHITLRPDRTVGLNYPAGRAQKAFQEAGFEVARNLIWMQFSGNGLSK